MTTDIKEPPEPREILKYINSTPVLQSLLYDIDLMPEQLKPDSSDYIKMLNIGLHFMRAQSAKLSAQTAIKTEQPSLSDAEIINTLAKHGIGLLGHTSDVEPFPLDGDDAPIFIAAYRALLAQRQDSKEPLVWESTTPCYTRFISEARYQKFSPEVRAWYRPVCEKCGAIDSDKDAERYRKAIAYEDNAGLLYCAVMNHCPDKAAIDAEFDAEAIDVGL